MPYNGQVCIPLVEFGERPESCWRWIGKVSRKTGYGNKTFNSRTVLAHRWVYEMLRGPIPPGAVVDHICGNRACVNPLHLQVVSPTENVRRGRATKLTAEIVSDIKRVMQFPPRGDRKRLAEKHGVSPTLISDIKYGRAWMDVQP